MGCDSLDLGNGQLAIVCTRGRAKTKRCSHGGCFAKGALLCDFKLANGRTCDAPICKKHSTHTGPDTDYCLPHAHVMAERC